MMLIRSDSGQLMLVSQQALAQAQQGPRAASGQASRIVAHQVCVCICVCVCIYVHVMLLSFYVILKKKNVETSY